jgi:polyferredoxin
MANLLCPAQGESKARFIFRWFIGTFVFGMVLGVLLELWLSANNCVNLDSFKTIVFWDFLGSILVSLIVFAACSFGSST